ncbi:MAG: PilT/PilU family type 4a pilus ATPase [Acidobacteriota bacterium]
MHVHEILKLAAEKKATDLHLKVGSHPVVRVDGQLQPLVELRRLQAEDTIASAFSLMSVRQREKFKKLREIDLSYSVPGQGRFRVHVFHQRGSVGLAFRVVPVQVPKVTDLELPPVLETIADEQSGLILCTGPRASGKSTVLAALVEHVNASRSVHVVTLEDPIEILHRDKKALVNQREVGVDTESFAAGLRSALRLDPDVVLVGELPDPDSIETALAAAENGHLVLSALPTLDAVESIDRLVGAFAEGRQAQVRVQLASVLRAVISLRMVPCSDGVGRVPAVEILRSTPYLRECIESVDKHRQIPDLIVAGGPEHGMQSFDQSLLELFEKGRISREEAERRLSRPDLVRRMPSVPATPPPASQAPVTPAAPTAPATTLPTRSENSGGGPPTLPTPPEADGAQDIGDHF